MCARWVVLHAALLVACSPDETPDGTPVDGGVDQSTDGGCASSGPSLTCQVLADEQITVGGWKAEVGIGLDASVHVIVPDWGGLPGSTHVMRRDPALGTWTTTVDWPLGDAVIARGGVGDPTLLVWESTFTTPDGVRITRWDGNAWVDRWQSTNARLRGPAPLALASDGTVHFALTKIPPEPVGTDVFTLAPGAPQPALATTLDGAEGVAMALDGGGQRHLVFLVPSQKLLYVGPSGVTTTVVDHPTPTSQHPRFAVAADGLYVLERSSGPPRLLTSTDGTSWTSHCLGDELRQECPAYGQDDTTHEGEACNFLSRTLGEGALAGGPRAVLAVVELEDQGKKTWHCEATRTPQCLWTPGPGFASVRRLRVGRATQTGVSLSPVELAVVEAPQLDLDQSAAGELHLTHKDSREGGRSNYARLECTEQ